MFLSVVARGCVPGLDRVLLGGQAERVPAHRMQHVDAAHALVARDDVGRGVALGVADVEARARRVREHVEDVHLGVRPATAHRAEGLAAPPSTRCHFGSMTAGLYALAVLARSWHDGARLAHDRTWQARLATLASRPLLAWLDVAPPSRVEARAARCARRVLVLAGAGARRARARARRPSRGARRAWRARGARWGRRPRRASASKSASARPCRRAPCAISARARSAVGRRRRVDGARRRPRTRGRVRLHVSGCGRRRRDPRRGAACPRAARRRGPTSAAIEIDVPQRCARPRRGARACRRCGESAGSTR